jgi:hypothetical protein
MKTQARLRKFLPKPLASPPLILAAAVMLPVLHGLCASPTYPSVVQGDGALGYYRFNDSLTRDPINVNIGSLGAAGNASNDLATVTGGSLHSIPGAIVGDGDRAAFFDFTTRTMIPFNSAINTPNTQPFSVEAWFLPVNDQDTSSFGGMGALCNRWAAGGNRQGWVMYERRPNANYVGGEGVGWQVRMYNDLDTSGHLDVISQVPYQLGKWQHVVFVYDPVQVTNATLTIYIDGLPANTNTWAATDNVTPGYGPCTGDHASPPFGQPGMALGGYNNGQSSGPAGDANPWIGGIDEFAWYPVKLTAAQILAHYQNGTNANRSQSYSSLIQSHNPTVYLRLNEIAAGPDVAVNMGMVGRDSGGGFGGTNGLGTNTFEVRHPAAGAIKSDKSSRAFAYHNRNGNSTTVLLYDAENNGDQPNAAGGNPNPYPGSGWAGTPFTFEAWLRPMRDQQGGQCPVNNRWVGGTGRTGWVIFQRFPNASYANVDGINNEGHGWCFRMFSGAGTSGQDVLTGDLNLLPDDPRYHVGDYTIGKWQHLVVTWEPQVDNGDPGGNGNNQWQGVLTAYVDGMPANTNASALYAANRLATETASAPADLAIGSYNIASTLGNNPFEGDVAELAIYNGYILTPAQILAHYQAGTNSNYGGNYAAMVMGAAAADLQFPGGIVERTTPPATYFRLNDTARYPASDSGSLGYVADGDLVTATNSAAGPQAPTYAGFEAGNAAIVLDGVKQWASFNNPAGLEISGQITLEAWVKPGASQGDPARIISHGPPTVSDYLGIGLSPVPDLAVTNAPEVFLRIDGSGANYVVGSTLTIYTNSVEVGTTTYSASFPVPAGDLGSANWIHLLGTYDGARWRLYRNGIQVASSVAAVGALPVLNGDWAVGSTGNGWANNYAGGVDEVAIYGHALTPSQVAAHYLTGKAGTAALTIINAGSGNVTVTWPSGTTLQDCGTVNGTYTDVSPQPSSPWTHAATGTRFYRWRL